MKRLLYVLLAAAVLLLPARAVHAAARQHPRFSASFLQNWMCRDWTAERWEEEFSHAKQAGFEGLILQSVCDIVRGDPTGTEPQDPASYGNTSSFCMYPSSLPALSGAYRSSQNEGDALALALEAARRTGMVLWIGTVNDDLWWKYGWGLPKAGGQSGTLFGDWCAENAALSAGLIAEIAVRYGETYRAQIGGFYYTNEIWNIDAACLGTDGGCYARTIGSNLRTVIAAEEAAFPELPLLISPFCNPDISTPAQFTDFLRTLAEEAGFRSFDICAPQDGGGAERDPAVIRAWASAQKDAVGDVMHFWINYETFGPDYTPKPMEDLQANYAAVSDLAEGGILFSWNHYYAQDPALDAAFTAFAASCIPGDVTGDGHLTAADVVLLQQHLHGLRQLASPDASDLDGNGICDVFDLALLRRAVLSASPA